MERKILLPFTAYVTTNKASHYLLLILKVAGQKEPSVQLKVKSPLLLCMQAMVRSKA